MVLAYRNIYWDLRAPRQNLKRDRQWPPWNLRPANNNWCLIFQYCLYLISSSNQRCWTPYTPTPNSSTNVAITPEPLSTCTSTECWWVISSLHSTCIFTFDSPEHNWGWYWLTCNAMTLLQGSALIMPYGSSVSGFVTRNNPESKYGFWHS